MTFRSLRDLRNDDVEMIRFLENRTNCVLVLCSLLDDSLPLKLVLVLRRNRIDRDFHPHPPLSFDLRTNKNAKAFRAGQDAGDGRRVISLLAERRT